MDIANHHINDFKDSVLGEKLRQELLNFDSSIEDPIESLKSKTSLRMTYEAQARVIQNQIGDLESVRRKLGLSARKMCQLLLVDPSAWTRWKKGENPPPHLWRSLQWYMTIQEKIPGLTPQYFIGKDPQIIEQNFLLKFRQVQDLVQNQNLSLTQKNAELEGKVKILENEIRMNRIIALTLGLTTLASFAVLAFAFFKF